MFRFEFTKLWRQRKLFINFALILLLMVGSLELSRYWQDQQLQVIETTMSTQAKLLKATRRPTDGGSTDTVLVLHANQLAALKRRDGVALRDEAYQSMQQRSPWVLEMGQEIFPALHAGEAQATLDELRYLKSFKITPMLPLTMRINPRTEETNTVASDVKSNWSELTQRFYEKGWYQIWLWASIGGIFIFLSLINLFWGDMLAAETEGTPAHWTWLKLNGIPAGRIVMTKFGLHVGLTLSLLVGTIAVFLLYAAARGGLGDLRYPVQFWQPSHSFTTFYHWLGADTDAKAFAPLKIVFKPLSAYLGAFALFAVALVVFNSALTMLVDQLVKKRFPAIIILVLLPLIGFVLPNSLNNPFTRLNGDWLITNYLGTLQQGQPVSFVVTIMILLVAAGFLLLVTVLLAKWRRKAA